MSVVLPPPIARYFEADKGNGMTVAECFTPDAIVEDERHVYRGIDDIRVWKENASVRYRYSTEPLSVEQQDGKIVVTGRVSGSFPGSPIDLRYFFRLAGDKIAELEIVP